MWPFGDESPSPPRIIPVTSQGGHYNIVYIYIYMFDSSYIYIYIYMYTKF